VLSVIIAILVLIIVFLLFKESILGLFEGMMYSEEEMEILRQNGLL
jgi:divalent metal cation (Fe/Co/Zn/Cd) transporter